MASRMNRLAVPRDLQRRQSTEQIQARARGAAPTNESPVSLPQAAPVQFSLGVPPHLQLASSVQREELEDEELDDLQLLGTPSADLPAESIRAAAGQGLQTPAGPLPFQDAIQAAFGAHDISHIAAHTGPEASDSALAMNASAYASGQHVVFAGAPDLHTAAHEAAHVVQQRAGVNLAEGVGRAGDAYENHANAVADRVAAGQSAAALLDEIAPGGGS